MYRGYLLAVLSIVFALNAADRLALGLLLQNIKIALHLTDLQLGLITGIAFALFYSALGVVIGVLADRWDRARIVSTTTVLWGIAVSLCSLARSFLQLLGLRIGVAIGESGCVPPSHSLLAETFSRASRPRATAIFYSASTLLSTVIGYFLVGRLNQLFGWRDTFLLLGLPGLVLAPIVWLTIEEPRKPRSSAGGAGPPSPKPTEKPPRQPLPVICVLKTLCANRTYRNLLFCFAVVSFFGYGIVQWQPSFFIRRYGVSTGTLGAWLTLIYGGGGALGTLLGGDLASRFAGGREHIQLATTAIAYVVFGVLSVFIYISNSYPLSLSLLAISSIVGSATVGPLFATIQTLVPPNMRAVSVSVLYLAGNLIGMGLGPFAVGAMSAIFKGFVGENSLKYALVVMSPGYIFGAWYFFRASTTVIHDLASLRARELGSILAL